MSTYAPPIDEMKFVLDHLCDLDRILSYPEYAHADRVTIDGLVDEAARFFADVVAPANGPGDTEGCTLSSDGVVTVPAAFEDPYRRYVEAGWSTVCQSADYGGGAFPSVINTVLQEMLSTSCRSFSMMALLTNGAIDLLEHFGSEEQRETFLPKMVSNVWSGTMNLTEPHAGSDVGALSTKAVPYGDGTYRITGTKIFITFGEHELTENIIHLVLARTPGSPPGTKGISCFIVPKYLIADDGSLGDRNDLRCVSIEHKLGLHGSPTCVMSYGDHGGAIGYLIGEECRGMQYMFKMMNNARLAVGVEGLAVTERSLQQSAEFARERFQGRAVGSSAAGQSAIVDHADVRRMLLTMRANAEAMRSLLYLHASTLDIAKYDPDAEVREAASMRAELLTPLSKAWSTDVGVQMATMGIQVHGGMGFIEETGVAQHLRDAIISPIYEGTNGIQAIDLVGRKLPMADGAVLRALLDEVEQTCGELRNQGDELNVLAGPLSDALRASRTAAQWLVEHGRADMNNALAGATPFLSMLGATIGGWLHAKRALAAADAVGAGAMTTATAEALMITARFFVTQLLPPNTALLGAVTAGSHDLFAIEATSLG